MKKSILIFLLGILIILESCKSDKVDNYPLVHKDTLTPIISKEKKQNQKKNLSIRDIEMESILDGWTDKGSFWLLTFKPNKVVYEFSPNCNYWFPSKIVNDEIIFYWALNENCSFDRGLRKTYKEVQNPEFGKPFGKVKIVNDTTIIVNYFYKDWIKRINESEKRDIDTLFPSRFNKIRL